MMLPKNFVILWDCYQFPEVWGSGNVLWPVLTMCASEWWALKFKNSNEIWNVPNKCKHILLLSLSQFRIFLCSIHISLLNPLVRAASWNLQFTEKKKNNCVREIIFERYNSEGMLTLANVPASVIVPLGNSFMYLSCVILNWSVHREMSLAL